MKTILEIAALAIALIAPASQAKIIALHGDSTQYGYGMQLTPSDLLQMHINKTCGVGVHTVVNRAWGGTTAQQALSALPASGMYGGKTFNGSSFKQGGDNRGTAGLSITSSALIYMNGTTDYLEGFAYMTAATPIISLGINISYFSAHFVRA